MNILNINEYQYYSLFILAVDGYYLITIILTEVRTTMKNKILLLLAFVLNLSATHTVRATDIETVFIEVDIYSIPASQKLEDIDAEFKGARLEESQNVFVHVGNDARLEVGSQSDKNENNEIFIIYLKLDQTGEYFDVDFKLFNKSKQSISKLEQNPLNSPLTISASINGITKLVQIKTNKFENEALALAFSREELNVITKDELATVKETANTLISVHTVELNNKGKPVKRTFKNWSTYQLINVKTQRTTLITQKGQAKAIYLEPGEYCLKSLKRSNLNINIQNSACFNVMSNVISNTGTWIIGYRAYSNTRSYLFHEYAALVDRKENYSDLESILEIKNSVPVTAYNFVKK